MSSKKLKKWASNPIDAVADLTVNALTMGVGGYSNGQITDGLQTQSVASVGKNLRDVTGITAAQEQADATRQMLADEQKNRQMQRDTEVQQQRARELELSNSAEARRRRRGGTTSIGGGDIAADLSSDFLGV